MSAGMFHVFLDKINQMIVFFRTIAILMYLP